jgi:hypothetical protein
MTSKPLCSLGRAQMTTVLKLQLILKSLMQEKKKEITLCSKEKSHEEVQIRLILKGVDRS